MSITIYDVSAPQFLQGLKGLKGVLTKAAAHAEANKIDPKALLVARLFPDMFHFTRQVQVATDFAKGACARLAQADIPVFADDEDSFEALIARIDKAADFIRSLDAKAFVGAEEREVKLDRRGEILTFKGQEYLMEQALPNFWFHTTTAYAILRHNGVPLTKRNYLGTA